MVEADTRPALDAPRASAKVAVVQDGARLHYAVPISLLRAGALQVMFSEAFLPANSWMRSLLDRSPIGRSMTLRGLLERRCDEIDPRLVQTNPALAIAQQWMRARMGPTEAYYERSSAAAGRWIRRRGYCGAKTLFGFVRNIDPALIEDAREHGLLTVVDQFIAPAAIEATEAANQRHRWPGWAPEDRRVDVSRVRQIEQRTWRLADRVTCASDYVRNGLIAEGVDPSIITVNPYPIDATAFSVPDRRNRRGVVTVGFVGLVGLRKGAAYFLQVARRLASPSLKFVMVGSIDLTAVAQGEMKTVVELTGRAPRKEIAARLAGFDIFFFPSTCEGSAGSVMEAMASGLPIVTSPNSGTIAREGVDGFVRNYDDVDGCCKCIESLANDVALRQQMGAAARQSAEQNNLARFGARLMELISAKAPQFVPGISIALSRRDVAHRSAGDQIVN